MKDISVSLGVSAQVDPDTAALALGVTSSPAIVRTLRDLAHLNVLFQADAIAEDAFNASICHIYREVDNERVLGLQGVDSSSDDGVKFDITSLASHHVLGRHWTGEFPKTAGHYHTVVRGQTHASPDFYQVAFGSGTILLQCVEHGRVRVFAIAVSSGDVILIPPQYAHATVNSGETPLVFANICVRQPHLNYQDIQKYRGLAYFSLRSELGMQAVLNTRYSEAGLRVDPLRAARPNVEVLSDFGVQPGVPIVEYLRDDRIVRMLAQPDAFARLFADALDLD